MRFWGEEGLGGWGGEAEGVVLGWRGIGGGGVERGELGRGALRVCVRAREERRGRAGEAGRGGGRRTQVPARCSILLAPAAA